MIRMFVRHEVDDYETWRNAYDDFDDERGGLGVRGQAVYRSVDNGNDVTAYHDFDSADAATAFAGSSRLREVMEAAGVSSPPQVWFVEQA
jgi:hypothetical protein